MIQEATDAIKTALNAADELAALKQALKTPYISLYLDGRNDHGTHVLDGAGGCSIQRGDLILEELDPRGEVAERIFKEAVASGHGAGHMVVARWRFVPGEGDGFSDTGYFEFECIDDLLTSVLHGSAEQQAAEIRSLDAMEAGQ